MVPPRDNPAVRSRSESRKATAEAVNRVKERPSRGYSWSSVRGGFYVVGSLSDARADDVGLVIARAAGDVEIPRLTASVSGLISGILTSTFGDPMSMKAGDFHQVVYRAQTCRPRWRPTLGMTPSSQPTHLTPLR